MTHQNNTRFSFKLDEWVTHGRLSTSTMVANAWEKQTSSLWRQVVHADVSGACLATARRGKVLKMLFEEKTAGRSGGSREMGSVRDAAEVKGASEMKPESPDLHPHAAKFLLTARLMFDSCKVIMVVIHQ